MDSAHLKRPGLFIHIFRQPNKNSHISWRFLCLALFYIGLAAAIPLTIIAGLNARADAVLKSQTNISQPTSKKLPQPEKQAVSSVLTEAELPPPDKEKLRQLLIDWVNTHPRQQWSVVIVGLDERIPSVSVNPNIVYSSASIFKMMLMPALFQKVSLDKFPTTSLIVNGKATSLASCVDLMLRVSNNPCGETVGRYVGWAKANKMLKPLGLTSTNLNNPGGPTTTAADTALFLKQLDSGTVFSADQKQYILDILKKQAYNKGIPAGCSGCVVANKTGELGGVRHDAGFIEYPGGKYALAIFTNGAPYSQIAQLTAQIQKFLNP